MKKISCVFLSAVLTFFAFNIICSAAHTDDTAYHWYCKNNDSNTQPPLPSEFSFIENHGGYYIDKNAEESDKVIYLTFDAGYENGNVAKILDILKAHNAKGAFFILANLINRDPDIVRRMADEGHEVCNHTAHHKNMTSITDPEAFRKELDELSRLYKDCTGKEISPFYRPPEGTFSERNLKYADELGYKTVFWSYAYADWDNNAQPNPEAAYKRVMSHTHNGEVLLLHPTSATNAEILDRLLTEWENNGYHFGTLGELTSGGK